MRIEERTIEHVVVGSGAAGFQAALRLRESGEESVAIVTENRNAGTSRNAGSDKQTYYKLSAAGGEPDSVLNMAEDLFAGQCVDGDQALCEAALSSRAFYRLVELGVPFPYTEYGEFMGYQTDHDRGRRATSAGPYTSRQMTECLEREAERERIPVLDRLQAIRLLVKKGQVYGVLCLDRSEGSEASYVLIWCSNVILATGGPAGMYRDSVYPSSQTGSSGFAFEAGARGKNLTEWQFGMASMAPRWNVSGTYMQVLPTVLSTDASGRDEREFLADYFETPEQMYSMIFLKGYQWPFDVNKILGGSSVIDLLVYQETVLKGRRVYLDYTRNAKGEEIPYQNLIPEAYEYLKQAGAIGGRPIDRLRQMNEPAIRFYQEHQVDLDKDRLEIAVCAQHNNGGLLTDAHWETNIRGLFAVGEVCASHGVARPGGTALNAGQVGAMRAAEWIRLRKREQAPQEIREELRRDAMAWVRTPEQASGTLPLGELWKQAGAWMSACGGMIRTPERMRETLEHVERCLADFTTMVKRPEPPQLPLFYKLWDMLTAQRMYLTAMLNYAESGAGSRGSALYTSKEGALASPKFPELFRCSLDGGHSGGMVQEAELTKGEVRVSWRPVRPIPREDYFFETQWKAYRERFSLL